jgi:hypothetical protein
VIRARVGRAMKALVGAPSTPTRREIAFMRKLDAAAAGRLGDPPPRVTTDPRTLLRLTQAGLVQIQGALTPAGERAVEREVRRGER